MIRKHYYALFSEAISENLNRIERITGFSAHKVIIKFEEGTEDGDPEDSIVCVKILLDTSFFSKE